MYRFQIRAATQNGEAIALVGSHPAMGAWDITRAVVLQTSADRYPLWWVELDLGDRSQGNGAEKAEYKYVKISSEGWADWEAWEANRWVPLETEPLPKTVIVDEGEFGQIPPYPYGYFAQPVEQLLPPKGPEGLKILVLGSSVALGCSAWLLRGWAWHLGQALQREQGHQLVNFSDLGANVGTTIARFSQVVAPQNPDIVIIALSLGNEGLASSSEQQQRAIQRRFENGLQQLIKMTRDLGARPILGGLYPNGGYGSQHYGLVQETHQRMLSWGVPVLDWWDVLDDGQGRWKPGISFDAAHPNSQGHQLMYAAIDRDLFALSPADLAAQPPPPPATERSLYRDPWGFQIFASSSDLSLRIVNPSPHLYRLTPDWPDLQRALRKAQLTPGLYVTEDPKAGSLPSFFLGEEGTPTTASPIPSGTDLTFYPAFHFFTEQQAQILFYDGHLGILRDRPRPGVPAGRLRIINQSDEDYNIHPMWKEVRLALKAMPPGVYADPLQPDAPFRTLMVGKDGLESRVKAPAQSAIVLDYQCSLSDISRVAILPLGDRCAVRMLLYKLEYDGPAFPFDLTRSTNLADVADIIQNDFCDMWNPALLHYNHDARRIYHRKWTGLSFAHEVEDTDDPERDLSPVHERMRVRYSARARRFWYTFEHCDKVLFIRTGWCDRATVIDLVHKLESRSPGKPFRLLLISPQASEEFANLPNVLHYNREFNPDRMYEDLDYWLACTAEMHTILTSLGVSSRNLFWCPPNPPTDP